MARFVVEPVVALKWFVPEEHSSRAARLLDGGYELIGPDSLHLEAGKLVAAKVHLGELTSEEGSMVLNAILSVPVKLQPALPMFDSTIQIAEALGLNFTDGMGLATAVCGDCRLLTARRTLYDRVQGTPFAQHVKWIEDIR